MLDEIELDFTVVGISLVLYGMVIAAVWFLPASFGLASFPLFTRIIISVIMMPVSYVIVNMINNK